MLPEVKDPPDHGASQTGECLGGQSSMANFISDNFSGTPKKGTRISDTEKRSIELEN